MEISTAVGTHATGKTRENINLIIHKKIDDCLIVDFNNEYSFAKKINIKELSKLLSSKNPKTKGIGIVRYIPEHENLKSRKQSYELLFRAIENTELKIIIEDTSIVRSYFKDFESKLFELIRTKHRHIKSKLLLNYQSLNNMPSFLYNLNSHANIPVVIRLHNTIESLNGFGKMERIAQKIIQNKSCNGQKYFFLYLCKDENGDRMYGDYTKEEYILAASEVLLEKHGMMKHYKKS